MFDFYFMRKNVINARLLNDNYLVLNPLTMEEISVPKDFFEYYFENIDITLNNCEQELNKEMNQ